MADCGNSDYQAVEYNGLFDLKDAQILRAQIDSIDHSTKTAEITLLDQCDIYAEHDLTAVEFYYHCEDSLGTTEDLERGYKAFRPLDVVYILAIPENGESVEKFYIVGHVDIRGTNQCTGEFLLIGMEGNEEGEDYYPTETWITIFDVNSGGVIDIDSFENKDELSPEKPTSLPCSFSVYEGWLNYNFDPSIAGASIGYALSEDYGTGSGTVTNLGYQITTTDDTCDGLEGNESTTGSSHLYRSHHEGINFNVVTGRYSGWSERRTAEHTVVKGDIFWEITDTVTHSPLRVYLEYTASNLREGALAPGSGILSYSASSDVSVSFSNNFDAPTLVIDGESSDVSGTYAINPIEGDFITCSNFTPILPVACIGAYGFYVLALCSDDGKLANRFYIEWAGRDWRPVLCAWDNIIANDPYHADTYPDAKDYTYGISYANISLFSALEGVDFSHPISPRVCMTANDTEKARGLRDAVLPLRVKILDLYHSIWSGKKPNMFTALRRSSSA